jgi:L-iditol 2-dehydrogenase
MPAAVYRGDGRVVLEEVGVPEIGAGEVLVEVALCGVCGTDLKKVEGDLVSPPRIFGHEIAGTIARVGAGVKGWKTGDRVALYHHVPCRQCRTCRRGDYAQCDSYKRTGTTAGFEPAGGGFARYVRVMDWIVRDGLSKVPAGVPWEAAAQLEPVNTCLKAVRKAGVAKDSVVLVMGQGPIGLTFTGLCLREGAQVAVCDPLEGRRTLGLELGASVACASPDEEEAAAWVSSRTEGHGYDVALVAVASREAVGKALDHVRRGGTVLLFAHTRPGDRISIEASSICASEKKLIGSYSADVTLNRECESIVYGGGLPLSRWVTHTLPLNRIEEAFRLSRSPSERSLKLMIEPVIE